MSSPLSVPRGTLAGFWRELGSAIRIPDDQPLAARLAAAAVRWTGARGASLFLREKEGWIRGSDCGDGGEPLEIPDPCPESAALSGETLWIPLTAEAETHGILGL